MAKKKINNKKLRKLFLTKKNVLGDCWEFSHISIRKLKSGLVRVMFELELYKDLDSLNEGHEPIDKQKFSYDLDEISPTIESYFINRLKSKFVFFSDAEEVDSVE